MEATASRSDTSCGAFRGLRGLDPNAIHRFVVGENTEGPEQMSQADAEAELGDPFATLLLLQGKFPQTAEETLEQLAAAAGPGDPLAERRSFVLGEGSQLIEGPDAEGVERGMRFVVSTGTDGADGPDVILSTFDPRGGDIELMSWDRKAGGFNYYRTVGDSSAWVFAGNSRHALAEPTRGKGPFESHTSGALVMKELKLPWNNWNSFSAPMPDTVFSEQDERRTHPWFAGKEGAEVCEEAVAIPSIRRWARARFDRIVADGGELDDPRRVLEQVLTTPTVNLASAEAGSRNPDATPGGLQLPPTFFADGDVLGSKPIGLKKPDAATFSVPTEIYRASLERFEFSLSDGEGFTQPGDTRFAFLVPERALEDRVVVEEAIRIDLLTPRLAAALTMVDFPNPIFSARREKLLDRVPATATVAGGASGFSQKMADAILAAAPDTPEGSAEREFADRWNDGEDFVGPFNALLSAYFDAVAARLQTQEGFDECVLLAESRRRRCRRDMPIAREFPLLFPVTNIEEAEREMRADGTVAEIGAE